MKLRIKTDTKHKEFFHSPGLYSDPNFKFTSNQAPVELRISNAQPFVALEMTPISDQPAVYLVDADNKEPLSDITRSQNCGTAAQGKTCG